MQLFNRDGEETGSYRWRRKPRTGREERGVGRD
jgi:hypothetical protein